jgi:hypothetical protein
MGRRREVIQLYLGKDGRRREVTQLYLGKDAKEERGAGQYS